MGVFFLPSNNFHSVQFSNSVSNVFGMGGSGKMSFMFVHLRFFYSVFIIMCCGKISYFSLRLQFFDRCKHLLIAYDWYDMLKYIVAFRRRSDSSKLYFYYTIKSLILNKTGCKHVSINVKKSVVIFQPYLI